MKRQASLGEKAEPPLTIEELIAHPDFEEAVDGEIPPPALGLEPRELMEDGSPDSPAYRLERYWIAKKDGADRNSLRRLWRRYERTAKPVMDFYGVSARELEKAIFFSAANFVSNLDYPSWDDFVASLE